MLWDTLSWRCAGAASMAPSQPRDHEDKQPTPLTTILYPYNHAVFHFQHSIQYITWDIQHFIIKKALC